MAQLPDDHAFYTAREAAEQLKCSVRTIDRYISKGVLEAKQGPTQRLIPKDSLQAFMGPGRRRVGHPSVDPGDHLALAGGPVDEDEGITEHEVRAAFDSPLSDRQLKALQTLFRMTGLEDRDQRLLFSEGIIGHKLASSKDLTSREAAQILDLLAAVEQGRAQYISDPDGRIVGAVPVDTDSALAGLHSDPVPYPDEDESS